jgi:hypothetical protein
MYIIAVDRVLHLDDFQEVGPWSFFSLNHILAYTSRLISCAAY